MAFKNYALNKRPTRVTCRFSDTLPPLGACGYSQLTHLKGKTLVISVQALFEWQRPHLQPRTGKLKQLLYKLTCSSSSPLGWGSQVAGRLTALDRNLGVHQL